MFIRGPEGYHETLIYSTYYAPRGRKRIYMLGSELSQRYLYPSDLLIGIIGSEGSGKSTLIQGLFPGLQLTNDDEGVNTVPALLYRFDHNDYFSGHTFHIDMQYELAFKQMHEIKNAVSYVIAHGRRVVVEHFDMLYKSLGYNAQVLFGIGDEVIVARPSIFGPFPENIKKVVYKTIKYRRMTHTAEDITGYFLGKDYGYTREMFHSDVKHGFIISFPNEPVFDIDQLEKKVLEVIESDYPIKIAGEDRIAIGDIEFYCTGTRTHVDSTKKIENFRLLKKFHLDPISKEYHLVGIVGKKEIAGFEDMTDIMEL